LENNFLDFLSFPPIIRVVERHYVFRWSVWPSVSVNIYFVCWDISVVIGEILLKLTTNNDHVSGNYCKGF